MEIQYDNGYGRPIEEGEISNYDYYSKIYLLHGEVKKQEFYHHGILNKRLFFTDENESREMLEEQNCFSGLMTTIGERQYIEEFKYEKLYHYDKEGNCASFSNHVYDSANHLIAKSFCGDINGEKYDWESMNKYYVDESIRKGDDLFECHFDASGKLIPIDIDVEELGLGDHDGTWIYENEEGVQDLIKIFGMSRKLAEFYTSSELFPWKSMSTKE